MALATGGTRGAGIQPQLVRPEGRLIDAVQHFNWRNVIRVRTAIYTAIYARHRPRPDSGTADAQSAGCKCPA